MQMRHDERDLEQRCVLEARRRGFLAWKNEKNGNKGIPDHSFITPNGRAFFMVEFKKDDTQQLRPEQKLWLERVQCAHLCFDFQDFTKLLDLYFFQSQ